MPRNALRNLVGLSGMVDMPNGFGKETTHQLYVCSFSSSTSFCPIKCLPSSITGQTFGRDVFMVTSTDLSQYISPSTPLLSTPAAVY